MEWTETVSYIIGKTTEKKQKLRTNSKVYAFDLDHTIIKPKKGKLFGNDWEFLNDTIVDKIQKLAEDYNIVIVSNQKGISMGKVDINAWKNKLEEIVKQLDIGVTVLASILGDKYRKPFTNLWDATIKCNKEKSFYCGDAGGLGSRKIDGKYYRDFSDSDLKFALNLGIQFVHRDVFAFGKKYEKQLSVSYPIDFDNLKIENYKPFSKTNKKEIIIMIGFPGSGKSYYCNNYILPNNYEYINQDTLKTAKKCISEAEKCMINNKKIVIDNTNPSAKVRQPYITLAKNYGYKVRAIDFKVTKEMAMHNNYFRHIQTGKNIVPNIVYNIYNKNYAEPTKEEGFDKIEKLQFKLEKIEDGYKQYMF